MVDIWLAIGTWALVVVTIWMASKQSGDLRTDLRTRLQLTFIDRFDNEKMIKARRQLAKQFLSNAPHSQIEETTMEFFDDMGLFAKRGQLDDELIWNTFGFYAVRWWMACKSYIESERKIQSDHTVFDNFESLAVMLLKYDQRGKLSAITSANLQEFLKEERDL